MAIVFNNLSGWSNQAKLVESGTKIIQDGFLEFNNELNGDKIYLIHLFGIIELDIITPPSHCGFSMYDSDSDFTFLFRIGKFGIQLSTTTFDDFDYVENEQFYYEIYELPITFGGNE